MKKGGIIAIVLFVLAGAGGGLVALDVIELPPSINPFNSDDPILYVDRMILSIDITGDTTDTLTIDALDKKGIQESFTYNQTNNHTTITKTDNVITISAQDTGIDYLNITSESGITKMITIKVFNPMILEADSGLLFAYTDQFTHKWDDKDTGNPFLGNEQGRFELPEIPADDIYEGFYPLGCIGRGNWDNPDGIDYGLIVKDRTNGSLLAPPTDYELFWKAATSEIGGHYSATFWKPIAPKGYVAMGMVVETGFVKPSTDLIRCVREDLTVQGKAGAKIWDNELTFHPNSISFWEIDEPDNIASDDGHAFLPANTIVGAPSFDSNDYNQTFAHLFDIRLPTYEEFDSWDYDVKLSDYSSLNDIKPRFSKTVSVPFTIMNDNTQGLAWKIENSPFYFIQRVETYKSLDFFDNRQGSEAVTKSISFTTGISETHTETFKEEFGIEVSVEGSINLFGPLGKWSVKISNTMSWTTTDSTQYSHVTTSTTQYTVPKGKFGQLLQVTGSFRLYTAHWDQIGSIPMESEGLKVLEYPL
ncbi:Vps62-related protein [Candidatus Lokiarchaeum ossiferum]|uniref:Vps62-related protein n=1 Tax=Candidatus Lokiarchaeum ossiferum TaxID=2951803 RepID=UPI00352C56A0